jgi:thioredoxin-related protein
MKYLLILLAPLFVGAQENKEIKADKGWLTDYTSALSEAKRENTNILLYFTGSDWCAPCKRLKHDLFLTEEFKALSKGYVLLYIDIPMNADLLSKEQLAHNKALLLKFNKKGVFPLLKVLDKEEKELDEVSGYNMNGEITVHLELLRKNMN